MSDHLIKKALETKKTFFKKLCSAHEIDLLEINFGKCRFFGKRRKDYSSVTEIKLLEEPFKFAVSPTHQFGLFFFTFLKGFNGVDYVFHNIPT